MRSGFTLVELVIVLVIAAMLTAIASLSLRGTLDQHQLSRAAEVIERFDAKMRRESRLTEQPVVAGFDLSRGRLTIDAVGSDRDTTLRLPSRVEVSRFRLRQKVAVGKRVNLLIDRDGTGPTYAIELKRGRMTRWLVVLGTSGQFIPLDSEDQVDAIVNF